MATCPNCKVSSRREPGALSLDQIMVPEGHPVEIDGRLQVPAVSRMRLFCERCGWYILGRIEDDSFVGDPSTQHMPKPVVTVEEES